MLIWSIAHILSYFSDGLELFRDFLRTEFSDENVEFWVACEEYKQLKTNYSPIAQRIYSDYVAIQAPREVGGQLYSVIYIFILKYGWLFG